MWIFFCLFFGLLAAEVSVHVDPAPGTPCLSSCEADPSSAICHECCITVTHEIDWQCGTAGAAACCSTWTAACWDNTSADNFYHACNQCVGKSRPEICTQFTLDVTPPTFTSVPADFSVEATSQGAVVTFTVTATDNIDPVVVVICNPASGTMFALGPNLVTCVAKDAAGNTAMTSFTVTVVGKQ